MAGAEIRAVWQRTANRCFVQEDAKRAPKLAYCQPPSSTSMPVDEEQTGAAEFVDRPALGFAPLNRNSSSVNLPLDARWCLQLQPSFGYQKGLTPEQLNSLEAEVENFIRKDGRYITNGDCNKNNVDSLDEDCNGHPATERRNMELEEFIQFDTREIKNQWEMDPFGYPKLEKHNECCFDPEFSWIEVSEKNDESWWRVTDKDDLASLVARKSLDHVENCDLPPPQNTRIKRQPRTRPASSSQDDIIPSLLNGKVQQGCIHSPSVHSQRSHNPESVYDGHRALGDRHSQSGSSSLSSYATVHKGTGEVVQDSMNDLCKAELLEALRYSQTRAREAEKAAKQACDEKDDIIKLLFKQASQLFAYKQWFQLLQLEVICYQTKDSEQPTSNSIPAVLPWMMPNKGRKLNKNWQKHAKSRRAKGSRAMNGISKYAGLVLGLGLVGAGLLLGWTVAWMLSM